MAEKYHVVGRYGGHKWHSFWLKDLDAREVFPLNTRLRLARLFEANTSMNQYSKTYIRTYCKHYKTLHCLPCCSNTLLENIQTLERPIMQTKFQQALCISSLIGAKYMMQELKHEHNNCQVSHYPRHFSKLLHVSFSNSKHITI